MRVVSYNILAECYVKPAYYPLTLPGVLAPARRREALLQRIASMDADVLCLQEVEEEAYRALAAQLTGYEGLYLRKSMEKPDGCATFWRNMTRLSERTMQYADGTGHVALLVELALDGRRLGIANTHLKWGQPNALPEADVALGQVSALRNAMVDAMDEANGAWISCGDFNATPESAVVKRALSDGWRDPYAGRDAFTCNAKGQPRRIDYILHTAALVVRPADLPPIDEKTPLPSETEPSDHLPITGEVFWA